MNMPKYNFQDLHNRPRSKKLPSDINEDAEFLCKYFRDDVALKELRFVQENRLYEEIYVYEILPDGKMRARAGILLGDGMAERWFRLEYDKNDGRLLYRRSILNPKLDKTKRRKIENGETMGQAGNTEQ